MRKVRISAVSYFNSLPMVYGLERYMPSDQIELSLNTPADCADRLSQGQVDLGLIPVAELLRIKDTEIVGSYCIAADGAVDTVCLFSQVPIHAVTRIVLDCESRSSVGLLRLLLRHHWSINPELIWSVQGETPICNSHSAKLLIGDKAFSCLGRYHYVYDLSEEWFKFTQLPFVFAAWVSTMSLSEEFIAPFEEAIGRGLDAIPDLVRQVALPGGISQQEAMRYFCDRIKYTLDARKLQALRLYLKMLGTLDDSVSMPYGARG